MESSKLALLISSAFSLSLPGRAQDAPASGLEDLEQKIGILERQLELKEEEAQKKKEETPVFAFGKEGFSLTSPDKEFQLKWRGYIQADARSFLDDGGDKFANTFLLRRVRPIWEGTLWKYYGFRIMPDFGGGATALYDAYVEVNRWPGLKLRAGKFKSPVGLERLQSATDLYFAERSYTAQAVPTRDVGVQLSGDFLEESYGYSLGLFNGGQDAANKDGDSTDHKDLAGRVFLQPFKTGAVELLRNLGVGFAASWGEYKGDSAATNLPAFRTPGQQTFFSYRTGRDTVSIRASGAHYRLNPQGHWYWGSLGLFGEYIYAGQEVGRGGKYRNLTYDVSTTAWQATLSYVVTGETPSFKGVKPRHPLSGPASAGGAPGLGALEWVARVSGFRFDSDTTALFVDETARATEAATYSAGLNWYLSRAVKWSLDYEATRFKGGAAPKGADRDDEHVLSSRLQANF